jgi:ketosteroid isomerase-like protein
MSGEEAIQEVMPLLDAFSAAVMSNDLDAVMALWAPDPKEIGPGAWRTYDEIVADYGAGLETTTFTAWDYEPFDAWVHGDAAYVFSRAYVNGYAESGDTVVYDIYITHRLLKVNGEWKMHLALYSPKDAPEGA